MEMIARFWDLLERNGHRVSDPRPGFAPDIEKALEGEMEEEERSGEPEPNPVTPLSPNVRLVEKNGARCLLLVAASASETGYWGVGVTDMAELRNQPLPWALVLLRQDEACGCWLDGAQVAQRAVDWHRIVPDGPNYEVRDPEELAGAVRFRSQQELFQRLAKLAG
ncbi:MAG: hypothetical protein HZA91_17295 [Verrucomicrobia bacterium]|nr:hypothetical protein [Verrucomicrobiota bacterium]